MALVDVFLLLLPVVCFLSPCLLRNHEVFRGPLKNLIRHILCISNVIDSFTREHLQKRFKWGASFVL